VGLQFKVWATDMTSYQKTCNIWHE